MYGRFINWFDVRSQGTKVALVFLALIALPLLIVLSPLIAILAGIMLVASLIMLLIRRRNGEPSKSWVIMAVASLLLVFGFSSLSGTIYGGTPAEQADKEDKQASLEQTTEEPQPSAQVDTENGSTAEEGEKKSAAQQTNDRNEQAPAAQDQVEDVNTAVEATEGSSQTAQVQPQTVEERIVSTVKKAAYLATKTTVTPHTQPGCYGVFVRFNENPMEEIEWLMEDIYAGLYNDPQLTGKVCNVTINAFGDIRTVGQKGWHKEKVYSTSLDATAAKTVNWKKVLGVNTYSANNIKQVWTTHFIHPATRQAKKEEQANDRLRRELDCLYDEGLFDVDVLCP